MKNRDKIFLGLGFGLLAGGATGYYLASDDGKKMRKKAKKKIKKINKDVQGTLKNQSEFIGEKLSDIAENAKGWANEMMETVNSKISNAEDLEEGAQESYQQGMQKAKKKIKENLKAIEEVIENNVHQ